MLMTLYLNNFTATQSASSKYGLAAVPNGCFWHFTTLCNIIVKTTSARMAV